MESSNKDFQDFQKNMSDAVSIIPLLNGQTIKEASGIKDEDLTNLYAFGCAFFEKGKFNEAEAYFRQLVIFDSTNLEYLMALGSTLQSKKLYYQAVDIYAIAHMLQENDSRPMFYAGQCHFLDRKYSRAKSCFDVVIQQNHTPKFVKMASLFLEAIAKVKKQGENND